MKRKKLTQVVGMSKVIKLRENWKGYFIYGDGYAEEVQDTVVHFSMDIMINNGVVSGTTVDEESKHIMKQPVAVNGFVDGDIINFIVKYPYCYYIDEISRKPIVLEEEEHPDIIYVGQFDEKEKKYIGFWYMIVDEEPLGRFQTEVAYTEYRLNGEWEMERII